MPRPSDRQISKAVGRRPLTPRQKEVLEEMELGGTEWEAYSRLVESGRWMVPYNTPKIPPLHRKLHELTFLNFRQHLINAYGRLQAHSLREALHAYHN